MIRALICLVISIGILYLAAYVHFEVLRYYWWSGPTVVIFSVISFMFFGASAIFLANSAE